MKKNELIEQITRRRLLEAAGEVFAEQGFRGATVREICHRAKTNVASVNYHFRDKETMYAEAVRYWAEIAERRYPLDKALDAKMPAEDRLRAYILFLLRRLLDDDRPSWHGSLMAREKADPSGVLDSVVKDFYKPMIDRLRGIVGEIIDHSADDSAVLRCALSIHGQCVYYHHARQVLSRLTSKTGPAHGNIEELAQHIADFSLEGLRGFAAKKKAAKR